MRLGSQGIPRSVDPGAMNIDVRGTIDRRQPLGQDALDGPWLAGED
jgi:hypothetical protein